ncbi:MAG: hypothetical protein ABW080_09600 [Candidatus Thiodiazotropha sp.]
MSDLTWTDKDFENMCWHDNHVHAMRIEEGEYGSGKLVLDIDHITEWCESEDGYEFQVVPAELTFHEVTGLRVTLDYATLTAALGPFSIASIEREQQQKERYVTQVWKILINWPYGEIEFEANGYIQKGKAPPVLSKNQWLTPERRGSSA